MTAQPKITLYWLNDSRAQRIVWLLEELGLDYEVQMFQRDQDMRAPAALTKVHPLGKAPLLSITFPDHPDNRQVVLAESGFIAQYLSEHFGQTKPLRPNRYRDGREGQAGGETDAWMRYQYFLHYAEGSLMPPILVALILQILQSPKVPFFLRPITSFIVGQMFAAFVVPEMCKHFGFLESQLETAPDNGPYLCGKHLSAADILLSFPLLLAKEKIGGLSAGRKEGTLVDKFPQLWAYLKRLEEEPGYKRAEAKIKELESKK
ncbi:hypothetical protein VTK26DRAFT_783 [Humicola hyalothermophila]